MKKPKVFILDMDGLMFETGRLAYRAYLTSAKLYDYQMTHDVYYDLTGRTHPEILVKMKQLYGGDQPIDDWRQEMIQAKEALLQQEKRVYAKSGLFTLLEYARSEQIKVIVASSNLNSQIMRYLEMEHVTSYIDAVVSGEEVKQGKPDPEIFLTALAKSGESKEHALVFEDSIVGIQAATNAGIASVLIPDDITDLPQYQGQHLVDETQFTKATASATFVFDTLAQATDYLRQIM